MAGTLTISTLSDGTNSTSSTNCIQGSAKAWVNFNGTGTVAIRASYNVSSITDNGTGDYTVNFTNPMSDADFSVSGWARVSGSGGFLGGVSDTALATTYARVGTFNTGSALADALYVTVAIHR